ncbi:HAD-IIIA family hydrolase [Streptomyces iconiensis]|uniref:D,D-heptose 1,7-bisphosphate phosphatase n=1 Tax=Streptomyces iconiensis TaxID=1384038 RepID=A0ABT6ZUS7_9ACTN|nr:HAD-IIIA family hydrolase [Streptomyces iconiensis]MDJ1132826.1 HAD-IIIA family hydrolase [Streptomyces iconiensis]
MSPRHPVAVLFDRDGTLVEDVPCNTDPALVRPMPTAAEAVALLRARGVPTGCVTNQQAVGLGVLTAEDVRRMNTHVDRLLGLNGIWSFCPHLAGDGCSCRKPAPGLVLETARRLGVRPSDCVVIGDIGADMDAARAAGARGVLVPTPLTEESEVKNAPETAPDLLTAVRRSLS